MERNYTIKRVKNLMDTPHPNVDVGEVWRGIALPPEIGKRFNLNTFSTWFSTSPVVKIEGNLIYTQNSVYEILESNKVFSLNYDESNNRV